MSQRGFQKRKCIFRFILCSGDVFFFFFLLLTWMKMYGARVCVFSLLLMGPVSPPPPPLPHHEPRQAEWQGSGLAKWWNDDPIMRSDSKMRGIRQRLHPSLTATPSPLLHTARCPDDDWFARDGSQEAPIDFAVFYQKYVFTVVSIGRMHTYPTSPFFQTGEGIKEIILLAPWQDKWPVILFQKRVNRLSD